MIEIHHTTFTHSLRSVRGVANDQCDECSNIIILEMRNEMVLYVLVESLLHMTCTYVICRIDFDISFRHTHTQLFLLMLTDHANQTTTACFFFFHYDRVNKSRTAVSKCSHDGPTFINTPIERKKSPSFSHQFLYKNAMERASRDVFLKNTKGEDKPNARKERIKIK